MMLLLQIAVLSRAWRMDFGIPSPRKGPRRPGFKHVMLSMLSAEHRTLCDTRKPVGLWEWFLECCDAGDVIDGH